jgi:hypothetical protein
MAQLRAVFAYLGFKILLFPFSDGCPQAGTQAVHRKSLYLRILFASPSARNVKHRIVFDFKNSVFSEFLANAVCDGWYIISTMCWRDILVSKQLSQNFTTVSLVKNSMDYPEWLNTPLQSVVACMDWDETNLEISTLVRSSHESSLLAKFSRDNRYWSSLDKSRE